MKGTFGAAISRRLADDGAHVVAGYWRHHEPAEKFMASMNIGQANYAASKSGLFGLTKTLAREAVFMLQRSGKPVGGGPGLTVNCVTPGYVATDMLATIPDKVMERIRGQIPPSRPASAGRAAAAPGRTSPSQEASGQLLVQLPEPGGQVPVEAEKVTSLPVRKDSEFFTPGGDGVSSGRDARLVSPPAKGPLVP
jgi:NAD(P)-dependent dehydrogenase (short-subunit alcohol dehydrogenase family)